MNPRDLVIRLLTGRVLRVVMWSALTLWIVVQVLVVCHVADIPQTSDAGVYQRLAEDCAERGVWYPGAEHIENTLGHPKYPPYICYPGLINMMALCIRIFGTYKAMFWLNIAFNCLVVWGIWRVARHLGGIPVARLCVAGYCLMPYASLMVGETMSEFPCMGLIMLSLALSARRGYGALIAAAVIMVLAQYVRTVAFFFAAAALMYMVVTRYGRRLVAVYGVTLVLASGALNIINHSLSGYWFTTSTTLGVNMRDGCVTPHVTDMAANDSMLIAECTGLDVFQLDSIQRRWAVDWICSHPGLFLRDAGPKIRAQLDSENHISLGRPPQYMPLDPGDPRQKPLVLFWLWYPVLYHALLLVAMCVGIWIRRRGLLRADGAVLLPFVCGLVLAVFTKAAVRYNLPYTPCMIYFAATALLWWGRRVRRLAVDRTFKH